MCLAGRLGSPWAAVLLLVAGTPETYTLSQSRVKHEVGRAALPACHLPSANAASQGFDMDLSGGFFVMGQGAFAKAEGFNSKPKEQQAETHEGSLSHKQVLTCERCNGSVTLVFAMRGKLGQTLYRGIQHNMTCKQWTCPACRAVNHRKLCARVFEGPMYERALQAYEAGEKYQFKFLTLTAGGNEYRSGKTIMEAVKDLARNFRKLMKAMKAKLGEFDYLRVLEFHEDGWPHLHVILSGAAIAPKKVLAYIEKLWRGKYGMGFVKLRARIRVFDKQTRAYKSVLIAEPQRAFAYCLNYLGKDLPKGVDLSYSHLFESSKGALKKKKTEGEPTEYLVLGLVSGWRIQDYDPDVQGDVKGLFLVRGKQALLEEMQRLATRGMIDKEILAARGVEAERAKTFRGKIPKELQAELLP